jgi:hypothetical protein
MTQPLEHAGRQYSNADAWRTAKRTQSDPKAKKTPPADMHDDEMGGEEPEDGAQIAEEHGPATSVQIQHDHDMGHHAVMSEHPDGHQHMSDHHESAEAAHEHAKKLSGVGAQESEGGEEDEGGGY